MQLWAKAQPLFGGAVTESRPADRSVWRSAVLMKILFKGFAYRAFSRQLEISCAPILGEEHRFWICMCFIAVDLVPGLAHPRYLRAGVLTQYQAEAAYLFNFYKFVDWPGGPLANTDGRWFIGTAGENPFGDKLKQLISRKTVQGHKSQVRQFQTGEGLSACHILFISASEKRRLPSILASLNGSSVLTVADMGHFAESGEMIQLAMEEKRVRFAIDAGASSRARLKVSSKLLSLVPTVTGADRLGNN